MRINIYAEELTEQVEIVTKSPENHPDVTFFAVRTYLDSPGSLHHSADDDDRSAITFWVPWTKADGHDWQKVGKLLLDMADAVTRYAVDHRLA